MVYYIDGFMNSQNLLVTPENVGISFSIAKNTLMCITGCAIETKFNGNIERLDYLYGVAIAYVTGDSTIAFAL